MLLQDYITVIEDIKDVFIVHYYRIISFITKHYILQAFQIVTLLPTH